MAHPWTKPASRGVWEENREENWNFIVKHCKTNKTWRDATFVIHLVINHMDFNHTCHINQHSLEKFFFFPASLLRSLSIIWKLFHVFTYLSKDHLLHACTDCLPGVGSRENIWRGGKSRGNKATKAKQKRRNVTRPGWQGREGWKAIKAIKRHPMQRPIITLAFYTLDVR